VCCSVFEVPVSSAYVAVDVFIVFGIHRYSVGPRIDPCGTPASAPFSSDSSSLIITVNFRFYKYDLKILVTFFEIFLSFIL
jgi:hypothetical protein